MPCGRGVFSGVKRKREVWAEQSHGSCPRILLYHLRKENAVQKAAAEPSSERRDASITDKGSDRPRKCHISDDEGWEYVM